VIGKRIEDWKEYRWIISVYSEYSVDLSWMQLLASATGDLGGRDWQYDTKLTMMLDTMK
jgi:hypothetical protein